MLKMLNTSPTTMTGCIPPDVGIRKSRTGVWILASTSATSLQVITSLKHGWAQDCFYERGSYVHHKLFLCVLLLLQKVSLDQQNKTNSGSPIYICVRFSLSHVICLLRTMYLYSVTSLVHSLGWEHIKDSRRHSYCGLIFLREHSSELMPCSVMPFNQL